MRRSTLTGKRAVWLGLVASPVLVVAAVVLVGVTAGSAGPSAPVATALPSNMTQQGAVLIVETALGQGVQTMAQLREYWTPERMASAQPMPLPTGGESARAHGSTEPLPRSSGERRVAMQLADGSVQTVSAPTPSSAQAFTESYHSQVPFMRWDWFGKYRPIIPADLQNSENRGISTVHKMFFSQGAGNFVCSSSTIGQDGAWTAGHCVHAGNGNPGTVSTNVMFCPSYDSAQGGPNPNVGCWGAEQLVIATDWMTTGNLANDYGGADVSDTPLSGPFTGLIGNATGWNGIIYDDQTGFGAFNDAWTALGYPAVSPFNGGKIHICSSGFGYIDDGDANAGNGTSIAIGCDMTGGSSGGPWYLWFGKPNQIGGAPLGGTCCNVLGGHNSWAHVGGVSPKEMNSPFFNCTAILMFTTINDASPVACS